MEKSGERKGEKKQHVHLGKSCSIGSEVIDAAGTASMFSALADHCTRSSSSPQHEVLLARGNTGASWALRRKSRARLEGKHETRSTVRKFKEHGGKKTTAWEAGEMRKISGFVGETDTERK